VIASDRSGRPVWRFWLIGVGVLALGGYLYLFITAILAPGMPPIIGNNSVIMKSLRVVGQHGKRLGWSFTADSSDTSLDGAYTTYHNVRDGTYYEKGKPAYHISAKTITLDTRSQNYTASGAVHIWAVTGIQPREIKAEGLTWNQTLQTLSSTGDMTLHYEGSSYNGSDLLVNFRDGTVHTGSSKVTYSKKINPRP
jgi:hypothetical protein